MPLSDIVNISITTDSARVLQAGFGVPLILSYLPTWTERTRTYTDLAGMVTDGFTATTPEYLAASAVFSQNPRVEQLMVGRGTLKPTQQWAITPVAFHSTAYTLTFISAAGITSVVTVTSDATATVTEIIGLLKTAIDALALPVTVSDQTTFMRIVANVAGASLSIEAADSAKLGVAQDHADPGVATDLAAIALESGAWYALLTLYNSKPYVLAAAVWVEANSKLYLAQTQDSAVINTAISGTDDIAEALKAAAYARTAIIYHPNTSAFAGAAWAGKCLPYSPGSETWKFKTLAGVTATTLTDTQRVNLRAKSCNFYETIAGVNITAEGVVAAGEFIDVVRGRDWFQSRTQERLYGILANVSKLPYTDGGVAVVEAAVRAQLQDGVDAGVFSDSPAPNVQVPKVSTVAPADKSARILRNVKFDAVLAGAIHKLVISGNISV